MQVEKLTPVEWKELAESAHLICFDELREQSLDRIDFALLATEDNQPLGYMTCREHDAETVYMQLGGVFPSAKDTVKAYRSYQAGINYLKERYKRAFTYIENTNQIMLKFAMKAGLIITGVKYFNGAILLEHCIEFQEETCGS